MKTKCELCLEDNVGSDHEISAKHLRNKALYEYSLKRKQLTGNRKGVIVECNVKSSFGQNVNCTDAKIKISVKPNEEIKFIFTITNATKKDEMAVVFVQIPQNKLHFHMNDNGLHMKNNPQNLKPKTKFSNEIYVKFKSTNIGQYEMPIFFLFNNNNTNEKMIITRSMVVFVEEKQSIHTKMSTPYAQKEVTASLLLKTKMHSNDSKVFRIPKMYKTIYANGLSVNDRTSEELKILTADVKDIFNTNLTEENYIRFFHNLLWYEETIVRINLKRYNMSGVALKYYPHTYSLFVPGLAEKRPSLMLGDLLLVKPQADDVIFEAVISDINENDINIKGLHHKFHSYHNDKALFDIRFFMSRITLERMHVAVDDIMRNGHKSRIFPVENKKVPKTKPIINYFNLLVKSNPEQRKAVKHIVAGTSGVAPFLLHGPPGTGKTVTVVEAVLQIINENPNHRVQICTDSNMAADHVATMLIKYAHMFDEDTFLLRANSKFRVWETLPECVKSYSNGTSYTTFEPVDCNEFLKYRIIITTLSHAAKYAYDFKTKSRPMPISHLFIDEAAQASEPACLIPACGLLQPSGVLVLAGDPRQLGPVVISHGARDIGLGLSLMERLKNTCPLYDDKKNDSNYMVMLRNNFRSDADILELPNELFYNNQLRVHAKEDKISKVDILEQQPESRAIVFHGVLSKEQKMGKSPSYFNEIEVEMVKVYVTKLISHHGIQQDDIGVITPYIRQVYKIKNWLRNNRYDKIEVGTVEAFQGKEKRVIVISTVRANCGLLDHDAKFQLGFLVDDKRFNVAITRAKAKVIIIGNPLCLEKDEKWRKYIQRCRDLGTYCGFDSANADGEDTQTGILEQINPMLRDLEISKDKTK